jgi:hypothetical protein
MNVEDLDNIFVCSFTIESFSEHSVDWLEMRSDPHHASYAEFYLSKPNEVFLRLNTA